jgi:hypothetical protein
VQQAPRTPKVDSANRFATDEKRARLPLEARQYCGNLADAADFNGLDCEPL